MMFSHLVSKLPGGILKTSSSRSGTDGYFLGSRVRCKFRVLGCGLKGLFVVCLRLWELWVSGLWFKDEVLGFGSVSSVFAKRTTKRLSKRGTLNPKPQIPAIQTKNLS